MLNIVLTGFEPGKKIRAIKAIRALTGVGLKEAKFVADDLEMGRPRMITTDATWGQIQERLLDGTISWSDHNNSEPAPSMMDNVLEFLDAIDPNLTVRQVYQVLRAANPSWRSSHYDVC